MTGPILRTLDRGASLFLTLILIAAVAIPVLHLLVPPSSPWHVPVYLVALWGKYVCFALLALSIDLIWGFAASSRSVMAHSSRSAVTPWACT